MQKNQRVFLNGFQRSRIRQEIRGQIPLIELHPFGVFENRIGALALIDGDDPFFTDLFHGIGHEIADLFIAVGADRRDALVILASFDLLGLLRDRLSGDFSSFENAALNGHGIHAHRHRSQPMHINRFSQNRRGGGPIAGNIAGLARHHVHELGAHVFKRLGKLDLFGYGDAILGDARAAIRFL